jgi:hypothetical protein
MEPPKSPHIPLMDGYSLKYWMVNGWIVPLMDGKFSEIPKSSCLWAMCHVPYT